MEKYLYVSSQYNENFKLSKHKLKDYTFCVFEDKLSLVLRQKCLTAYVYHRPLHGTEAGLVYFHKSLVNHNNLLNK